MELRYSRHNLLNAVLRDAQGKPIYRIETPHKWTNRTTTISRFVPGRHAQAPENDEAYPLGDARSAEGNVDTNSDTDIHLMGLEEEVVAEIRWHAIKQSVFVFGGRERKLGEYLKGNGVMRRQRTFTASDGHSYKWILGVRTCWLKTTGDDGSTEDVEIARYHRPSIGVIGKAHTGWLEVLSQAEPILHEVVMTFVWIERRRKQRERAARSAAASGGGGGGGG